MIEPAKINAQCATPDDIYIFSLGDQNYGIVQIEMAWEEAALCAQELNGFLVEIETQEEQDAIYNAILSSGISPTYSPVPDGGGTSYIWIGATDKNEEGTWLWDGDNNNTGTNFWIGEGAAGAGTGSAVENSFINWGGKSEGLIMEPDNYSEQDAAAIALTGWPYGTTNLGIAGEWNDIDITNEIYFIVEIFSVGMDEKINSGGSLLYPNPSKNFLVLCNVKQGDIVNLFGTDGRSIPLKKVDNTDNCIKLDISDLNKGLFFIIVRNETGITTHKFMRE
jgi:hypothetical protein